MITHASPAPHPPAPWRSVGVWMSVVIALLMAFNAARATLDPMGFAVYFGTPVSGGGEAFVHVYAIRAAFLAVFTALLLATGQVLALKWLALAALVMPIGDMALTWQSGAPFGIVARHAATAVYLLVTAGFLHAWLLQRASTEPRP